MPPDQMFQGSGQGDPNLGLQQMVQLLALGQTELEADSPWVARESTLDPPETSAAWWVSESIALSRRM